MQQIAEWLERLGLGQYAKSFAENDISFQSYLISRIKTSRTLGCPSVIDASCCVRSPTSTRQSAASPATPSPAAPPVRPEATPAFAPMYVVALTEPLRETRSEREPAVLAI
jgi:hypothetical protein